MTLLVKITAYRHDTRDSNYERGEGPDWYNGSASHYSLAPNDYDHLLAKGYRVSHTEKTIEVSAAYFEQMLLKSEGYGHMLARAVFDLNMSLFERVNQLRSKVLDK